MPRRVGYLYVAFEPRALAPHRARCHETPGAALACTRATIRVRESPPAEARGCRPPRRKRIRGARTRSAAPAPRAFRLNAFRRACATYFRVYLRSLGSRWSCVRFPSPSPRGTSPAPCDRLPKGKRAHTPVWRDGGQRVDHPQRALRQRRGVGRDIEALCGARGEHAAAGGHGRQEEQRGRREAAVAENLLRERAHPSSAARRCRRAAHVWRHADGFRW